MSERHDARRRGSGRQVRRCSTATPPIIRKGPHDQPQSMCPAFGSLRVGLRMRRTATMLSGSACCVYGLTFTSHFYGAQAQRRLRAVHLRDAGHRQAVRGHPRSGRRAGRSGALRHDRRHQPVRADRVAACRCNCCPRRSTACASSASTCRASACRRMPRRRTCWPARCCAMRARRPSTAPCAAPAQPHRPADGHAARRDVPGRPAGHRADARAAGPGRRAGRADARMARAVCGARLRGRSRRSIRSTPPASASSRRRGGRSSARRRSARRHGGVAGRDRRSVRHRAGQGRCGQEHVHCPRSAARSRPSPISGRITVSGYEGSELLVARLLIESGADVRYVGTACPRTVWSDPDREWLEAQGVPRPVPRLPGAGHRRGRGVRPRTRDRHHAGRAERQGRRRSRRCISPTSSRRGR